MLGLSREHSLGLLFPFPVKLDAPLETEIGPDGTKWAQLNFSKASWGGAPAFLVQLKDVSDRKREETRLRKAVDTAETRTGPARGDKVYG